MKKYRNLLKVSFLIIAFAISLAILSACNSSKLPSEHFDGNCIQKGYTRYYMPNGTHVDREDKDFGPHSYNDGEVITEQSCTQDGVIKFTCDICHNENYKTEVKLGHDYTVSFRLEPTCTDDGHNDYKCGRCNDTYTESISKLGHDYKETIITPATCTKEGEKNLFCNRCHDERTAPIQMLPHDDEEVILKNATCTDKGSKSVKCKVCHRSDVVEIDLLPHTSDQQSHMDNDSHWSFCTVCNSVFDHAPHSLNTKYFDATCIEHAIKRIECTDCSFNRNEIDESSPLAAHNYEAYTCIICQRDNMLDYIDVFNSRGTNNTNLIKITSENMLVCFYDYLLAYQITTPKYIQLSYKTLKANEVYAFCNDIRRKITGTNWHFEVERNYDTITEVVTSLKINAYDSADFVFSKVATLTPDAYNPNTYVQYDSYQFSQNTALRPVGFDNFAYKSRLNQMEVSSSDQLFFAFEHGYKPIAKNGTSAQRILNKAKTIARNIMNDSMTDLQKVKAIYSYLVSDVEYDYGVVDLTNDKTVAFSQCSSYYLEGVFDYGIAVCDGISKAFCVLAGLEDIKCVRVTSTNHAWNKVYIDVNGDGKKAWFGTDATWGNQGLKFSEQEIGEYLSIEDFLFTDSQKSNRGQTGLNYVDTNSMADTVENPYKYFYFDRQEDDECDFVITSNAEVKALIAYLKANYNVSNGSNKITVQIFVVSTFWRKDVISNELYAAILKQWAYISSRVAFTISENTITYGNVTGCTAALIISN